MQIIHRRTHYYSIFRKNIEKRVIALLPKNGPIRYQRPKIIRDAVFSFIRFEPFEVNIIDTPLIQRLRNISQTALTLFVYPSSSHSRFEHSLSCAALTSRFVETIRKKSIDPPDGAREHELRLAGILHDCGHGPFSHTSEDVYKHNPIFEKLRDERPELFEGGPAPHEIMSYFIITSNAFNRYWDKVVKLYSKEIRYSKFLNKIDLDRIGLMVIGKVHKFKGKRYKYLDQIINGPFDVDKLDYIHRDGYFTGLGTTIDLDRLFQTVDIVKDKKTRETRLVIDSSGATALEQLLFSKMLIFSVVYHHQKVRASSLSLARILSQVDGHPWKIGNAALRHPWDFLRFDDYDILNSLHQNKNLKNAIDAIRNRNIPQVAIVIAYFTLEDKRSRKNMERLSQDADAQEMIRNEIANTCKINPTFVYVDMPKMARFIAISEDALIRVTNETIIELEEIYPTSKWVSAYSQNRYKGYIFCPRDQVKKVAKAALKILRSHDIMLTKDAFALAKHENTFIDKLFKN